MSNDNTTVIKARGRRDILTALVILCAVVGGVFEYQQAKAPLDEATFFLTLTNIQDIATEAQQTEAAVSSVQEKKFAAEINPQAASEFFSYMDDVHAKVDKLMEREGSVLDYIQTIPEVPQKAQENKKVFQDGQIEIYDSEAGVVAVVDETKSADAQENHPDDAAASQPNDKSQAESAAAEETEQKVEQNAAEAQQKVKQQVAQDLLQATNDGEEAPVVLLPGMGIPAPAKNADEEEINLEDNAVNLTDEVAEDMKVINKAMEEIDLIKIDDLSEITQHLNDSEETASELPNPANLSDDADNAEAVNMLQQIGQ